MTPFYWMPQFWFERVPTPFRRPGQRIIEGFGVAWLWWSKSFIWGRGHGGKVT